MRAVVIARFGGPEVLELRDVPKPAATADHVLVRVHASALNRADLLQRRGHYPAPPGAPAEIPGLEYAGEVAETGPLVTLWKPGDRVFGICGGGAQAEYVVVPERTAVRIPQALDWTAAAAVPEAFITAHDALLVQAGLRPGERVLINAVGSGVGLAAVQLAKATGASSFGTARQQAKLARAKEFGMGAGAVVRGGAGLAQACVEWLAGSKFDVVLELAGGDYVTADLEVLGNKGRLMLVGTMAGQAAEINLSAVLGKRIRIVGTVLRSRPLEEKISATQAFAREVVPLLESGVLRPVVDEVFPLDQIQQAHQFMEENRNAGKIVVTMD
jgi:putative PIG3 family NAD(P)H quinone oxidoreductase